jgi:hypothetical protein
LEAIYQIIGGLEEDEKNNTFASSQNNVLALEDYNKKSETNERQGSAAMARCRIDLYKEAIQVLEEYC